jgi:hypothetical protein
MAMVGRPVPMPMTVAGPVRSSGMGMSAGLAPGVGMMGEAEEGHGTQAGGAEQEAESVEIHKCVPRNAFQSNRPSALQASRTSLTFRAS